MFRKSAALAPDLAHPHVERAVGGKRETALRLIELHGRYADIHRDAIDLRDARRGKCIDHFGEAVGVQDQARRLFLGFAPFTAGCNSIRVTVERVNDRALFEQGARIATCAERRIDQNIARLRVEGGDNFFQKHGNMGRGHLPFPFVAACSIKLRQAA